MTVKYCIKTHSQYIKGNSDIYYSDPSLNAALATAEKFLITARVSNATGTTPSLFVTLECSNDNVNWQTRSTPISLVLTAPLIGCDMGDAAVVGRFLRVAAFMGGTGSLSGYVEIWVSGRSYV